MLKVRKCSYLLAMVFGFSLVLENPLMAQTQLGSPSPGLSLLAPIYDQFPQLVGLGHSTWSTDEHKFLRQAWMSYMQKGPKSWAPSETEWKTMNGRTGMLTEKENIVSINGHKFYPQKEIIDSRLMERVEKAIDAGLDYDPSILDLFVSKADAQASLFSRQLSFKVLFTLAALKTCSSACVKRVQSPKISSHK